MNTFYPSEQWKFCPYCGSASLRWESGTHCMLCLTCARSFYINASAAVVALISDGLNRLLFVRRKNEPAKGTLDFPGGFINLDETAEDAVKREVKEELNIEIKGICYYGSFHNRYLYDGIMYFTADIAFKCSVSNFEGLKAADDVSGYEFIHPSNIDLEKIGLQSIKTIAAQLKNAGK